MENKKLSINELRKKLRDEKTKLFRFEQALYYLREKPADPELRDAYLKWRSQRKKCIELNAELRDMTEAVGVMGLKR